MFIIQSLYIIFMLNFFKTKYNFSLPYSFSNINLLKHSIEISEFPDFKICKLGKILGPFLALFILIRNNNIIKIPKFYSKLVLFITFSLSLLNLNAVLYLIPHFILEIAYLN